MRDAALARRARAPDGQAELQQEEVLEDQAAAGRLQRGLARLGSGRRASASGSVDERCAGAATASDSVSGTSPANASTSRHIRDRSARCGSPSVRRVDGHQRAGVDRLVVAGLDDLPVLALDRLTLSR